MRIKGRLKSRLFFAHRKYVKKMRLDKYLKVSRLIKRRTVANDACDAGRVTINDKPAKASTEVKIGDVIGIKFADKVVTAKVTRITETIHKEDAKDMYELM